MMHGTPVNSKAWWRRLAAFVLGCGVLAGAAAIRHTSSTPRHVASSTPALAFEPNRGQADERTQFVAHGAGFVLGLEHGKATLTHRDGTLGLSLVGANEPAAADGIDETTGRVNYFIGNDPSRWLTDIPTYRKVRYRSVYPGVDLVFYGNAGELEYDLLVAPGADPSAIALRFDGAERVSLDEAGDLDLTLRDPRGGATHVRQHRPRIYQTVDGVRHTIEGGYTRTRDNEVAFWVGPYDRQATLTIDPVIVYANAFGQRAGGQTYAIAVHAQGSTYVTGWNPDASVGGNGAAQHRLSGGSVFVAKFDPSGQNLVYATYLGGGGRNTGPEIGYGIAVDSAGNAHITGETSSTDFPTVNALQSSPQSSRNAFVARIDSSGTRLMYSTYLGARDGASRGLSIAVDAIGNAYVGGATSGRQFPATTRIGPPGTFGTSFVTKFSPGGSLVYSTVMDAPYVTGLRSIAVDGAGQAHVVGAGMLAKLSVNGSQIVYSTTTDSSVSEMGRVAQAVAVDGFGNAYITGSTSSNTLRMLNAAQRTYGGGIEDTYVASFGPTGALRYSTYLGGITGEFPSGIAADPAGNVYVTGMTNSPNFPVAQPILASHPMGPVFRSADGGGHWGLASSGLTVPGSSTPLKVIIDPGAPDMVFLGTNGGVFKTTDGGARWIRSSDKQFASDGQLGGIISLAIDPRSPSVLYAGAAGGTYMTTNGGARWFLVSSNVAEAIAIGPSMTRECCGPRGRVGQVVYLGGRSGIQRSLDGGRTWMSANQGLGKFSGILEININSAGGTVYAKTYFDDDRVNAPRFKSTDGGLSWVPANFGSSVPDSAGWHLTFDPVDGQTFYASNLENVFKTIDGGVTWRRILDGVRAIAIGPAPQAALYVVTAQSVDLTCDLRRSTDGGTTWQPAGEGLYSYNNCVVDTLAVSPSRPGTVFAAAHELWNNPFLTRLAPDGSLIFSTYFDPTGYPAAVAVGVNGDAYLTGAFACRDEHGARTRSSVMRIALLSPPAQSPLPFPPVTVRPCMDIR